jgi:hypothetical protein
MLRDIEEAKATGKRLDLATTCGLLSEEIRSWAPLRPESLPLPPMSTSAQEILARYRRQQLTVIDGGVPSPKDAEPKP